MSGRRVAVVTDSTADLPPHLLAQHRITAVPLTVTLGGRSYLDGVEIQASEFYRLLEEAGSGATTSQPSPGLFAEAYRRLLADHDEVLSIHISEKLSGTFAAARQGAEMVDSERIQVVDSGQVSMPLGLIVLAAAAAAAAGAATATVLERVRPVLGGINVYFMVGTLEHLRRGGRIGRASALLGSVLQMKPVLTIQDGQVAPLERVRTYERALARIIELARSSDRGAGVCAIVGHAAAEPAAERVARELEDVADTLLIQPLGPVVGAHAGPGTVGIGCYPAELFRLGLKDLSGAAAS